MSNKSEYIEIREFEGTELIEVETWLRLTD